MSASKQKAVPPVKEPYFGYDVDEVLGDALVTGLQIDLKAGDEGGDNN